MALLTDDQDIRDVRLWMEYGGNGDYYINLIEYGTNNVEIPLKRTNMRISVSGGNAPTEVKLAVANLFRAMEAAGLNNHPKNDTDGKPTTN